MVDYVILPLREKEAKEKEATHGAYRSDNVVSIRLAKVRRQMMVFLDFAFGDKEQREDDK